MNLDLIKQDCAELNRLRGIMRQIHEAKQKEILRVSAKPDKELRELQNQCAVLRNDIIANIAIERSEFISPKTREFSGITVGFEKERDSLQYPPDEILIPRIKKLLPKIQQQTVLQEATTILRTPLKKLGLSVLQKLGIRKVTGADQPVVRANDDDIEVLVEKSLGEVKEAK